MAQRSANASRVVAIGYGADSVNSIGKVYTPARLLAIE
jgi:hypothetical protein